MMHPSISTKCVKSIVNAFGCFERNLACQMFLTDYFFSWCNELGVIAFITFHDSLSLYNIHLPSTAYLNTSSTPATKPATFTNICSQIHFSPNSPDVSRTVGGPWQPNKNIYEN